MRHLLLTNDFPPKVGGIRWFLWELRRRLPPDDIMVFTASYPGAAWWDGQQKFRVIRAREPVLLPQPYLARRVRRAARHSAPGRGDRPRRPARSCRAFAWAPLRCRPARRRGHGAGAAPRQPPAVARSIRNASLVIAAGNYPEAEPRKAVRHGAKVSDGVSADNSLLWSGSPRESTRSASARWRRSTGRRRGRDLG